MTNRKPNETYPGEEVFVKCSKEEYERDYPVPAPVTLYRKIWAEMTKTQRYKWLAQHEAYRLLKEFADTPKLSLNEPSDCLSSKVRDFLKETYGVKYNKKHIANRFLADLRRPKK